MPAYPACVGVVAEGPITLLTPGSGGRENASQLDSPSIKMKPPRPLLPVVVSVLLTSLDAGAGEVDFLRGSSNVGGPGGSLSPGGMLVTGGETKT